MDTQDTVVMGLIGADCGNHRVPWPSLSILSLNRAPFRLPTPMQHWEQALHSNLHLHIHSHNWFLMSLCWRGIKLCAGKNCSRMEPCSGREEWKGSLKKTLSLTFRRTGSVLEATEAACGQWGFSLSLPTDGRMESELSPAGRLHKVQKFRLERSLGAHLLLMEPASCRA